MKSSMFRLVGNGLIFCLIILALFDALIMFGVVPYELIYGAPLADPSSIYVTEGVPLFLALISIVPVMMKMGYAGLGKYKKTGKITMWLAFVYFLVSTLAVGVLLVTGFSLLTLVLELFALLITVLSLLVALHKEESVVM